MNNPKADDLEKSAILMSAYLLYKGDTDCRNNILMSACSLSDLPYKPFEQWLNHYFIMPVDMLVKLQLKIKNMIQLYKEYEKKEEDTFVSDKKKTKRFILGSMDFAYTHFQSYCITNRLLMTEAQILIEQNHHHHIRFLVARGQDGLNLFDTYIQNIETICEEWRHDFFLSVVSILGLREAEFVGFKAQRDYICQVIRQWLWGQNETDREIYIRKRFAHNEFAKIANDLKICKEKVKRQFQNVDKKLKNELMNSSAVLSLFN